MALMLDIPKSLIYEEINGEPVYYKGYKNVLAHQLEPESIIGSSVWQSYLVTMVARYLGNLLPKRLFFVLSNEAGLHIERGTNLSNDVAVFDRATFPNIFSKQYANTPPKLAIEVDIDIESETIPSEMDYVFLKSQKMLDFGTERILWILTASRKIFAIDRATRKWTIHEWEETIPLFENYTLCLNDLLREEDLL